MSTTTASDSHQNQPPVDLSEECREVLRAAHGLEEDLSDTVEQLTSTAVREVDTAAGFITLPGEEGHCLHGCAGRLEEIPDRPGAPIQHSISALVLDANDPLAIDDVQASERLRAGPVRETYGAGAYLGIPLAHPEGCPVGVFALVEREPRRWTEADVSAACRYADLVQTEVQLRLEARRREEVEHRLEDETAKWTRALSAARSEAEKARRAVARRLARAAGHRDIETGKHVRRVGRTCRILATELDLSSEWQHRIKEAAMLHDVGKIGIPDQILHKPGSLTDAEYDQMKQHTLIGADMLEEGESDLLRMAERIARSHHERWDGDGYPDGLAGEKIPLAARIVSVADAFDAMTNDRPYRDAMPLEKAFRVIEEEAGRQLDPQVSEAALRRREHLARVQEGDAAS